MSILRDGRRFLGRGRTVAAIGMPTSSSQLLAQTSQRGSTNTSQHSCPSACMDGAFRASIPPRDVGGAQVEVVSCTLYLTPLFSAEVIFILEAHHGRQAMSHCPPTLPLAPALPPCLSFPFFRFLSLSLSLYLIFFHTWTPTDVHTVSRSCLCFLEYGYRTPGERNGVKTFSSLRWASPGYFLGFLFWP